MRIRTAIAVAALLPATLAFAVSTDDGPLDAELTTCRADAERTVTVENENGTTSEVPVEYCQSIAYAQCTGAVDSQAAGKLVLPLDKVALDAAPPPGSFQEGEGCGTVDEPVFGSTAMAASPYHYYLEGFLLDVGNLDTVTFEVHFLGPNVGYAGEEIDLDLRMAVDGVSLFGFDEGLNVQGEPFQAPKERTVKAVPTISSTGLSSSFLITVTDVDDLAPHLFASEPGQGSRFRQLQVGLNFPHLEGPCVPTPTNGTPRCPPFGPAQMVMGADEVPTAVILNTTGTLGATTPAGDLDDDA